MGQGAGRPLFLPASGPGADRNGHRRTESGSRRGASTRATSPPETWPCKECAVARSGVSARREEPEMRKLCAAMAITVASLALFEGCAPVPLPHYAAYRPRRVMELLVDSENMRQAGDDWERFWLLDQPSHLTPYRLHGGIGP